MLYVGVDAHSARSQITVMDEKGKIVKRANVASNRDCVRKALGAYRQPMKAGGRPWKYLTPHMVSWEAPLQGLTIGKQLRYLAEHTHE